MGLGHDIARYIQGVFSSEGAADYDRRLNPPERSVDEAQPDGAMDIATQRERKEAADDDLAFGDRLEQARELFDSEFKLRKLPSGKFDDYVIVSSVPEKKGERKNPIVYMVKHTKTQRQYALRKLRELETQTMDTVKRFHRERTILRANRCEFIVGFELRVDKPKEFLGTLLEFMKYGSLANKSGSFPEQYTRQCAAQIIFAIEYLHELGFVYRGLTLRHVLVCDDFYIKISNFMDAKRIEDGRTHSFVKAFHVMPPEALQGKDYGKGVDWWSLGILIHQMLYGKNPFCEPTVTKGQCIQSVVDLDLNFPNLAQVSSTAKDMMEKLLKKEESERLVGAKEILEHRWFGRLPLSKVYLRKMEIGDEINFKPVILKEMPAQIEHKPGHKLDIETETETEQEKDEL